MPKAVTTPRREGRSKATPNTVKTKNPVSTTMPKEQKNQLPPHARIEKLEREIPIAKQLLAEDMQKLKDAKKEYEECLKAAARLHVVKKQVNKLHLAEVNWLQLIAQMEEELKLLKR